ncbi:MAG: hypothetical protein FWD15_00660 [Alphaproteobacteria bacterium]|nr:hypothetical protein [Alphaproteobacteria bacterium]
MSAPDTKLTRDAKLLLASLALKEVPVLFMGAFFVSFIMQNSASEMVSISLYNIFLHIIVLVAYFLLANWIKRKDRVVVFRAGVASDMFFLSAIVFLGEAVVGYIIPLSIMVGITAAMYWAPLHYLVAEKVPADSMTRFTGYRALFGGLTKIVAPIALGIFITLGSYEEVAKALMAVCLIKFSIAMFIKPSTYRSPNGPDFKGFWRCTMRHTAIAKMFVIEMLRGISLSAPLGTIITMYTVYMFKTDFKLGMFTTIFAAFSLATAFLFSRFGSRAMFPRILAISTLAVFGGVALFVSKPMAATFLIYNFVYATAAALLDKIALINFYNLSKSSYITKEHKVEYFVFRDAALNTGRIISFVGLLLIGIYGGYEWLRWYLIPLTLAAVFVGYLSIGINKHIK